jgi:hypothetical protein
VLSTLYVYPRAAVNRNFLLAVQGSAFDTAAIQFLIKGGSCGSAGCVYTRAQLTNVNATQAIANFYTQVAGEYTLQLRNGPTGPLSVAVARFTVR